MPAWLTEGPQQGRDDASGLHWVRIEGTTLDMAEKLFGSEVGIDKPRTDPLFNLANGELTAIIKAIDRDVARLAYQGPLHSFFSGIAFDPVADKFVATTPKGLEPFFENMFTAAATSTKGELPYLQDWDSLLYTIANDLQRSNGLLTVNAGFIFTNIIEAYEHVGLQSDIKDIAETLGVPRALIVTGGAGVMERAEGGLNGNTSYFYLNAPDQIAKGGQGSDTYIAGQHFGNDVIDDFEAITSDQAPDYLKFSHYNASDITASRDGVDLVLTLNGTTEQIRILNQYIGGISDLSGGEYANDYGINSITFADGEVWDKAAIAVAASRNTTGDDHIVGTDVIDFLNGGLGNDLLEGGRDGDTYFFDRGFGQDTILEAPYDAGYRGSDTLMFGKTIKPSDLTFVRPSGTDDLVISIVGSTETITIQNQFKAFNSLVGINWRYRIETLLFEDGSIMDANAVMKEVLKEISTVSNDHIVGYYTQDRLNGGKGNDFVSGGENGDTYVYNRGDGHDTILDGAFDASMTTPDTIVFGGGISVSDVKLQRDGSTNNMLILINGQLAITVQGQFDAYDGVFFPTVRINQIENLKFADGTVINSTQMMATILSKGKTTGDDVLNGYYNQDRLDGGAGNDVLNGGNLADTYVFGHGYGHDIVFDQMADFEDGANDTIEFTADVLPTDIVFSHGDNYEDLVLKLVGTNDQLTLKSVYGWTQGWSDRNDIELFKFADGTVWTNEDVRIKLLNSLSTSGNDVIHATQYDDIINGGLGDDTLIGHQGHDTYVFGYGSGHDVINDDGVNFNSADRILFSGYSLEDLRGAPVSSTSDDLQFTFVGGTDTLTIKNGVNSSYATDIEFVAFSDGTNLTFTQVAQWILDHSATVGNDTLVGTFADETIDGGLGDDLLIGHQGTDTYVFGVGGGHDTIYDNGVNLGSADKILFTGYTLEDLRGAPVSSTSDDLKFTFVGGTDTLTIKNGVNDSYATDIEFVTFADGTQLTITQAAQWILDHSATTGNDTLIGTYADEVVNGGVGNDTAFGNGGNDTYLYARGDGNDIITEDIVEGVDKLVLIDILTTAVTVTKAGNDLIIHVAEGFVGANDSGTIILKNSFDPYYQQGLEQIEFADGTIWSHADILSHVLINEAPILVEQLADISTLEDTAITFTLPAGSFADADNEILNYSATLASGEELPTWLTFDSILQSFSGIPPQNFNGSIDVKVTASDGNSSASDVFTIAISPVNDAPIVATLLTDMTSAEDTVFSLSLPAGSFSDVDNLALNYSATLANEEALPPWLTFNASTQSFNGTPPQDFNGDIDVKVTASDGSLSVSDIFKLTITPVNDAPVANNVGPVSLFYNVALSYVASALLSNALDVDGDQLTIAAVGNANHGTVAIQSDGSVLFTPDADFIGTATFSYTVIDPSGATSIATVTINVHGVAGQTIIGTSAANILTGTAGNDTISGLAGNDTLNGNGGVDTLIGGIGNDIYVVDSTGDKTIELLSEGIDTVQASLSWSLSAYLENLTLTGAGNFNGIGNDLANTITGNGSSNLLNGGLGADRLVGGLGDDTYVVDNSADVTTEAASAGTDTVLASLNWTLATNVENLFLTGTTDLNGTGNTLANKITGNSGNNVLNGGTGADTLIGGLGDDTYRVDNVGEVITELLDQGIDAVQSSVTYTLAANLENLTLLGTAAINGTGNDLNNNITGNTGNNILDGGLGSDTLIGNIGNDIFVVDNIGDQTIEAAGAGTDTVKTSIDWALAANIENLTLTGAGNLNGFGNELANTLTGNTGNNILDGGLGADKLVGGLGDDTFIVDDVADVTTEVANAGKDTVLSSINWTLATNVEGLILTGNGDVNGTGNSLANIITGNAGNNILSGGTGADTLIGGLGNDTYIVDNVGDVTSEAANEGTDFIQSSVTWNLGANLENLTLTGTSAINGTGNAQDNALIGNAGANKLSAGDGSDTLTGGAGNDTLTGGLGDDTFNFSTGFGKDTITDFSAGSNVVDTLKFNLGAAFDSYLEVMAVTTQVGANTLITIDTANTITLTNVLKTSLVADDFIFT